MSEAPSYRWEFVVRLSGFGATSEEAWESVQERLAQDGIGDVPEEVDRDDDEAYRHRMLGGEDVTVKIGFEDDVPEGVLVVWEDKRSGGK